MLYDNNETGFLLLKGFPEGIRAFYTDKKRFLEIPSHDIPTVLTCITYHYTEDTLMAITSIRISRDIEKPLESLSKKLDRSKNYLINQAIKEFLARQSVDESRWQDTLEALESIKAGKSIDEDDVNAWLNSWGTSNHQSPPES